LELLPPAISDSDLFALLADILSVSTDPAGNARLRLKLIGKAASWQALVDLADEQGLLPPFVWALKRRALLLPVPSRLTDADAARHPTVQLEMSYGRYLERRQRQRDQLAAVVEALNRASIEPCLIKGARYLLAPVGSWSEARDMRDLDLLVRRDEAERAVAALVAEGYAAAPNFGPIDQHLPELWKDGCPSAVELHVEALAFAARAILPTDELWRRGVRLSSSHGAFVVLPDEWQLLVGLLHHQISDRGHVRRVLAVKPLWEFAMLGNALADEGWRAINAHMTAVGQGDVFADWIVQAAELFGLHHPRHVEISPRARTHALATIAAARGPTWLRRARFLADQVSFGFSRETMAVRYRLDKDAVNLATYGRHLQFLLQRYRGRVWQRLTGRGDRLS
jgi:hypothetical protein